MKEVINGNPFVDTIVVTGSNPKISLKSELHIMRIQKYFRQEVGWRQRRDQSALVFQSPPGHKTAIVKFEHERGGKKGARILLQFPGSFMYEEWQVRVIEIKNFALKVFKDLEFESSPHFSQVDFTIDRYNANFETHAFNMTSGKYELYSSKRKKKVKHRTQSFFEDTDNPSRQTGQIIKGNKMWWRTYDRLIALLQRYSGEQYRHYRKHYEELYDGFDSVLREEIKLKKNLLDTVNAQFWGLGRSMKAITKEALSYFGDLYYIIDTNTGEPAKEMKELFDFGYYKTRKEIFKEIGIGTPSGDLKYTDIARDPNMLLKQIADYYLASEKFTTKDFLGYAFALRKEAPKVIDRHIQNLTDRMKTEMIMCPSNKKKIKSKYDKAIQEALELKKKYPENLEIIKQELREAIEELDERKAFLK